MRIGVLDQSPVISGHSPAQAVHETIRLAQAAEQLGFHRYWLAEHHSIAALADPCPEILLARVAAATSRIRVGTGGVLLPYYSPLKVAEQFRMLEALYPGRIDLGIGRAPGGDQITALAMGEGRYPGAEHFPEQVQYLVAYLDGALPPDHPFAGVKVMPAGRSAPEVWLLGSSDYSGALASRLGLRFAFAHFISADGGDVVMRDYQRHYEPSRREPAPQALLCVFVICAETSAEAERLAGSIDLRRLNMDHGVNAPVPSEEEARNYLYTEADRRRIAHHRRRVVLGEPAAVRDRLLEMKTQFQADELMAITITGSYDTRLRSYELLAEAFGLAAPRGLGAGAPPAGGMRQPG
ncbi:MAG TPA: LLM class flavin-dependent oxidoreductase [Burkholderiales bacterium]|nr:LLM class flavin-dependent oxidoreductase [Burkholderiales bacterium]